MLEKCVCIGDIERQALDKLSKSVRDYYASGSDNEITLKRNIEALKRF